MVRYTNKDADSLLGAYSGLDFSYNYDKLTSQTHSKLVERLRKDALLAWKAEKDYAPIFLSQLKDMIMLIDIFNKGESVVRKIADEHFSDTLTIIYKRNLETCKNHQINFGGYCTSEANGESTKYLYIIHPVTSLSDLLLSREHIDLITTSMGAASREDQSENWEALGIEPGSISDYMKCMPMPLLGTRALTKAEKLMEHMQSPYTGKPGYCVELKYVHDVRYKAASVKEQCLELSKEIYNRKHCKNCTNALICTISNPETFEDATFKYAIKQACRERYVELLTDKVGFVQSVRKEKILLADYRDLTTGEDLTGLDSTGFIRKRALLTRTFAKILANLLSVGDKPRFWIEHYIKSGAVLEELPTRLQTKMAANLGNGRSPHHWAYDIIPQPAPPVTLDEDGEPVPWVNKDPMRMGSLHDELKKLTLLDTKIPLLRWCPISYDARNAIGALAPKFQIADKPLRSVIPDMLKDIYISVREDYYERDFYQDMSAEMLAANISKISDLLVDMVVVESGKYYLEMETRLRSESIYESIFSLTELLRREHLSMYPQMVLLNLKELKYTQKTSSIKLGGALAEATKKIHKALFTSTKPASYGKTDTDLQRCPYAEDCLYKDLDNTDRCSLSMVKGEVYAAKFGGLEKIALRGPCSRPITADTDMIAEGADVIYNRLMEKIPSLDSAIRILASHVLRSTDNTPDSGGPYSAGMNDMLGPINGGTEERSLEATLFRSAALIIDQDFTAHPVVLSPERYAPKDTLYTSLVRLKKYAPTAFIPQVDALIEQWFNNPMPKGENRLVTEEILWFRNQNLGTSNSITPGCGEKSAARPYCNLRKESHLEKPLSNMSTEELIIYEAIKLRMLPLLAPIIDKKIVIEIPPYPYGAVRFQKSHPVGEAGAVTKAVMSISLFRYLWHEDIRSSILHPSSPHVNKTYITHIAKASEANSPISGNGSVGCSDVIEHIRDRVDRPKALLEYKSPYKYMADSTVLGYEIDQTTSKTYLRSDMPLGRRGRVTNSYSYEVYLKAGNSNIAAGGRKGLLNQLMAKVLLTQDTLSTEVKIRAIRIALHAGDPNTTLGLWWAVTGETNSAFGQVGLMMSDPAAHAATRGLATSELGLNRCPIKMLSALLDRVLGVEEMGTDALEDDEDRDIEDEYLPQ